MAAFGTERQGRRGSGVALCAWECFGCTELNNCDDEVECLWVGMRGKANKASSCIKGGLDWVLGKISSLKEWSGIGTGCLGSGGDPIPGGV